MKILITGGAGYIGSTIASALADAGHTPILLDSLITGREEFAKLHTFYHADIADQEAVRQIFSDHPDIYATITARRSLLCPSRLKNPTNTITKTWSNRCVSSSNLPTWAIIALSLVRRQPFMTSCRALWYAKTRP